VKRTLTITMTLALALTACTSDPAPPANGDDPSAAAPVVLADDLVLAGSLTGFDACDEYLAYVQDKALEIVTPWGLDGGHGIAFEDEVGDGMEDDAAAEDDSATGPMPLDAPEAEALVEGEDFSGTNVQEQGVDEPDHVKTDGRVMYVVADEHLRVLDVTGEVPALLTSLELRETYDAQLLLADDRLLLTSSAYAAIPFEGEAVATDTYPDWGWGGTTSLTMLDVSDPSNPVVTERLTVDGATLSSRLVDGVARVVVRTEQGNLAWEYPSGSGIRAERAALEANREVIRASGAEDWIPYYVHETADGEETEGPLLACNRIARPTDFAGLGVLSVLTVDLASGGLEPGAEAMGLLTGGDTVYASRDALYVATTQWIDWEGMSERARQRRMDDVVTDIHAFDITDPRDVGYLGSGSVPGTLLSQWALSEYDGDLRVASTIGDPWGWGSSRPSESAVTVLSLRDDELEQVGQVTGLGVTERIYAVRFLGDVGYVVTFRETDPLYTIDLSDPTDPQVAGELKILGYSAYLHPMGDDLLLGVGQDADLEGRTLGTQLSLFDVSDPADPRRIDQVTLSDGSSEVEYDHRAFLHWPQTGLTVVPFTRWRWDEQTGQEDFAAGAVGFSASREDGLERIGLLSHRDLVRAAWEEQYGEDWLEDLTGEGTQDDWLDELEQDDDVSVRSPDDRAEEPVAEEEAAVEVEEDWADDGEVESDQPGAGMSAELGRWWDWNWQTQLRRSVVVGDRLLTVSDAAVKSHELETLEDVGGILYER
jgi:hypothetical protein